MPLNFLSVHQAATDLVDCICTAVDRIPVEVPGLAGCPCRVGVVPGAPAADGCDGGCNIPAGTYPGQLTVNVVRTYSTTKDRFPLYAPSSPDSVRSLKPCQPDIMAVDLAITLWRCSPLPTDQGCPPTMPELGATAMQLHADIMAVQQGIACCYAATDTVARHGRRYALGQTLTLGPQGGCVGLQTALTVALDDCLPCPPVTPAEGP